MSTDDIIRQYKSGKAIDSIIKQYAVSAASLHRNKRVSRNDAAKFVTTVIHDYYMSQLAPGTKGLN